MSGWLFALLAFAIGVLVGIPIGSWGLLIGMHGLAEVRRAMRQVGPGLFIVDGGRK